MLRGGKVVSKNKKLPFQVKLLDVSDINPRAGFETGQIYDVYSETREGYEIWSDTFGMVVEVYFGECEKIEPDTERKGNE